MILGLATAPQIRALLAANRISATPIAGKWECYGRAVIPAPWNKNARALVIFGSDTRGTIWGVVDLTREMGASAWEWWADVKIERRDHLSLQPTLTYSKPPSVKYRGIFLNAGEHGLNPWAGKTYDPAVGNFGPRTYERIFELMWRLKANIVGPEDDFGYIRRLSNAQERQRPRGSGIYYHDCFWGPPMAYMWLDSPDVSLMWEEMMKAYAFDARQLWMLNVGSIKPGEPGIQFFLDTAFDATAFKQSGSVRSYLDHLVEINFGTEHAAAISDILWSYYKLYFSRNPEFMGWTEVFPETPIRQTAFNMLNFGDENARRSQAYEDLASQAAALSNQLPADRRAAFYELVQYPVDIARDLNLRQLDLDKTIAYGLQHRASADEYAQGSKQAQADLLTQTHFYNDVLAGGKWRNMVTSDPHPLPVYEAPHIPTWSTNGDTGCGVQVEGGAYFDSTGWWTPTLPALHPELHKRSYVDIFVEGPVAATWSATPNAPWIHVSKTSGSFSPIARHLEDRLVVSLDWAAVPPSGDGLVTVRCSTAQQPMAIPVHADPRQAAGNASFIEASRIVSMYAVHTDARTAGWEVLEGVGDTGADLRSSLAMQSIDPGDSNAIRKVPSATYRFTTTTSDDTATLKLITLPTFPITSENELRLAASIDGAPLTLLDLYAPEFSETWRQRALSNMAVATIPDLHLKAGVHTVTLYALDPGLVLDRIEVDYSGAPLAYGPVPETKVQY